MSSVSCRACMETGDTGNMHYIFATISSAKDLFIQFTSIQVEQDDGLPAFVCMECMHKLNQFQDFRKTCIASDKTFQEQLVHADEPKYKQIEIVYSPEGLSGSSPVYDFVEEDYTTEPCEPSEIKTEERSLVGGEQVETSINEPELDQHEYLEQHIIVKPSANKPAAAPVYYECDICGKICHKRHRIEAHLREHCGLKPFACPTCGVAFQKWSSLDLHMRKHNSADVPLDSFPCTFGGCTKSYDLRQSLKVHYDRVHLGIKPNRMSSRHCICETCGKSFKSEFFLRAHSYTHVGKEYWPFPCEICPKRFISKYKFKIHMMRHNNIKNFACPLCDMRTCTNKELQIHIAYHNEHNDFVCESCPSTFRSKVALQRHHRIVHRGHKPYECTFCKLTFAKAETLKHHTMRHTGEKPHACQLCDRRFIQLVALRAHMKTHNKTQTSLPIT